MKKVTHLKDHSKDVEINNVMFLERRAMRKNVLKFGAMMILVSMLAMGVLYFSLMRVPVMVHSYMIGE